MSNATLLQINARLDAFQVALQSEGCTPEQAQDLRDEVFSSFTAETVVWDAAELTNESPTLLETLIRQCRDRLEFHVIKEFVVSNGETIARCTKCRFAQNYLSDDYSISHSAFSKESQRERHTFNRHLFDWRGFTKRHQVAKGKTLVAVKRTIVSSGLVQNTNHATSAALKKLCGAKALNLAAGADSAGPSKRQQFLDTLADSTRTKTNRPKAGDILGVAQPAGVVGDGALDMFVDNHSLRASGYDSVETDIDRKYKAWQREKAQTVGTPETVDAWEYLLKTYPDKICERWKQYLLFFEDVGSKPDGKSLVRWRDSGLFEKGNVAWMTKKQAAAERAKRF